MLSTLGEVNLTSANVQTYTRPRSLICEFLARCCATASLKIVDYDVKTYAETHLLKPKTPTRPVEEEDD